MNHSGINMKIAMQPFPSFQIIIGPPSFRLTQFASTACP